MIPIVTLTLVIGFSMLVTKIATIALVHTGMSKDRAKFQARSAFSGAGFTTSESEVVVKHPIRRRIITILIITGNAGLVTAVSSLILGFVGPESTAGQVRNLTLLFACVALLFIAARSQRIDRVLSRLINRLLERYTDIHPRSFSRLMTLMDDFEISEIELSENKWLAGKTLAELGLQEEGLLVLGIIKADGSYIGVPRGRYVLESQDDIVVYGRSDRVKEVTNRPRTLLSEQQHQENVQTHRQELKEQDETFRSAEKP